MSDAPTRRLVLKLKLGADDLSELAHALKLIGNDLEIDGRETRDVASGGYASGYHLTLTCDESMTGERFRSEISEWAEQHRVSQGGEA